jgi:translocation and assembly module TamB
MKLRWYSWVGIALLAIVLIAVAAVAWAVGTNAGARWVVARAQGFLGEALQVERVEGALAGPLTLTNVAYRDPAIGVDVAAEYVHLDLAFLKLLGMTVHVVTAELRGVDVHLTEPTEPQPEPPVEKQPFTLEAPIDIVVERFVLNDLAVINREQPVVTIDSATFIGQWIGSAIAIRQLDVQSPDGEAHFVADVRQSRYYEGEGNGRFRWKAGDRTVAGALEANGREGATNLRVDLTAPLTATLAVEFQQTEELPWKLGLEVPTFDPRESLLPESSLQTLAARLHGAGALDEGAIAGVIEVNGEPIRLERIHFAQREQAVDLDALVQLGGGNIAAKGVVHTAQEPVAATLNLNWSEVVVPESLAGQAIFTRGNLDFEGSAESYRATGTLSAGPKDRIANLELKVQGTSERIEVEQLDIVQQPGRFAMNGTVELQPQIGWSLRSEARQFDPGAFAVEWPGSLNFDLNTQGTLLEEGPEATVVVENLRGRLRNRDLGGRVNLALAPNMAIEGNLDLRSGKSRLQLVGRSRDETDAVATISVPSLNDWLPDGSGELRGRITAKGKWPELNVAGELNGNALQVGTLVQAERLAVEWNIDRPTDPSGRATLSAAKLAASGFEFDSVRARVEGDKSRHSVDFDAAGAPLGTAFLVEGALDGEAWEGTIQRLVLDVKDAARLTLQEPVTVGYSPELVQVSQACFADGDIRLCMQGDRASTGVMHAIYSLQSVPLALANAFLPASMPLRLAGTFDGAGNIESTADGVFKGRADIRSASGQISREGADEDAPPDVLLRYADLSLSAEMDGPDARAQLNARLDESGALNGRVALQGLAEPTTNLEGQLSASLPSLRVIELFAPQLANVQGRADLRADVRGSLDAPQVAGEFRVSELGMDVPAAGLELRQGNVSVTALDAKRFKLTGGIASGPGRVDFDGEATTDGIVAIKLAGKQFQAANIPSANVIIEPDLNFERGAERMTLTGSVHIPAAEIDLSKLPQSQSTQGASSDVVIVDAEAQEVEQAADIPLHAQIKVTLGEKVTLMGYGLNARVLGQLTVNEQPGSPTSGSGEVRVEGTYKAYGQDLTIQKGQLVYAGTPLDNPRMDLVAVRKIEEVTAGLRVTGSAQSPQLTVFSEPAMGQSDALAYLVTGKPLSEVGQGNADEGDMLQTAARSLGTAAGGVIAKSIGKRLGVDEFGVTDNEAIGGAALTIGQYLSPRLYLGYGVGLFEPGQVITLRYKLSRSLALEVLNATQDQRAGLEYRKEK